MRRYAATIVKSFSEILFLNRPLAGLLLGAMVMLNPNVGVAGLAAVAAAYLFAAGIRLGPAFLDSGFYTYNPLLTGLAVGHLFALTPATLALAAVAGVLTFIATVILHDVFTRYLRLPILSLPFVVVAAVVYLAGSRYSNLLVAASYPHGLERYDLGLPVWLAGFFKSLGAVFFMPYVPAGLLAAAAVLVASRILFVLAASGYYLGAAIAVAAGGSFEHAFANEQQFNSVLIAAAVGAVFLVPSPQSYLLAMLAVAAGTLLLDATLAFAAPLGLPAFTLPFNAAALSFLYVLGWVGYPLLARYVKNTPEETLDHYLFNRTRFRGTERTLTLPFTGTWSVWQAFDGPWTHKGAWRHAYDFVIRDERGATHRGDGAELADYHCYRKPVLAPVRGLVVKVVNHLPDNPPGEVDAANQWGNAVVIRDERGFFVELSHFAPQTVAVKEGEWVVPGTLLGLCGNSGYSPQPHVHVQVQLVETFGAPTAPFSFANYAAGGVFHANDLPAEGDGVEPLHLLDAAGPVALFLLEQESLFDVSVGGRPAGALRVTTGLAPDGTFSLDSGRARLYFTRVAGAFYFVGIEGDDPHLASLLTAFPSLPANYKEGLRWTDTLPAGVVARGARRAWVQFFRSFYHGYAAVEAEVCWPAPNRLAGVVRCRALGYERATAAAWDERGHLTSVTVGDLVLCRRS